MELKQDGAETGNVFIAQKCRFSVNLLMEVWKQYIQ